MLGVVSGLAADREKSLLYRVFCDLYSLLKESMVGVSEKLDEEMLFLIQPEEGYNGLSKGAN